MKEMLKSKWMMGFMVVILSITYVSSTNERKMNEEQHQRMESEVVFTQN